MSDTDTDEQADATYHEVRITMTRRNDYTSSMGFSS